MPDIIRTAAVARNWNFSLPHAFTFINNFISGPQMRNSGGFHSLAGRSSGVEESIIAPGQLSNQVGFRFDTGGTAPIQKWIFGPHSELADDVMHSSALRRKVLSLIGDNVAAIDAALALPASQAIGYALVRLEVGSGQTLISFLGSEDADLHLGIGSTHVQGAIEVKVRVSDRKLEAVTTDLWFEDLYDWQYGKAAPDSLLAQVQAGAGVLGDRGVPFALKVILSGELDDVEYQF